MSLLLFTSLIFVTSLFAGLLGALTGLGGGVVIVPALVLLFKVDLRYAIGASLVSVIATSSGAAAAYVKEGLSNIRIGMFLEVATTLGALLGAYLTAKISSHYIAIIFGAVLLYSAHTSFRGRTRDKLVTKGNPLAISLQLSGTYPTPGGPERYHAEHVPLGFGIMFGAGTLSGLLGIGSGAVKVLAMDEAMGLPFKVSTTTSNFMIGVTAAASAGIYLARGYIDAGIAMPVMLGVLAGSMIGSRLLVKARVATLKVVFGLVIVALGFEMIFSGLTGRIEVKTMTDKEMELSIAGMLRFGVSFSAVLVLFGGILYLRHPWLKAPSYGHFVAVREPLHALAVVFRRAIELDARSVITLGILVLIATPIVRVAFCIAGFERQKDRLYVLISASVFAILIYGLIQGGR